MRLVKIMSDAAKEFTVEGFNKKFIEIQKLNPRCAMYLVDMGKHFLCLYTIQLLYILTLTFVGFEHWTRAHFEGRRFHVMDSNIAESWNAVVKEARKYPLICMFEYIKASVISWFALCRKKQ